MFVCLYTLCVTLSEVRDEEGVKGEGEGRRRGKGAYADIVRKLWPEFVQDNTTGKLFHSHAHFSPLFF